MKNLFKSSLAILIGLSLTMSACKKEESKTDDNSNNGGVTVPQTQKSTVIYFGGTWCGPCGAYGKPAKEQIKAAVKEKCSVISCQVLNNDPMISVAGDELAAMFKPSGVPAMYIGANDEPIVAMIGGSTATGTTAIGHVNTQSAKTAKVNMVLSHTTTDDGLITVNINGKFFSDLTDEYYISGYLLEDKLNYAQTNDLSTEKNIHYNVMRAKYGTSATGELIKAAPKKDETFTKTMGFFIQPTFKKENLSVVIVVWKKGTSGLTVSNSANFHL